MKKRSFVTAKKRPRKHSLAIKALFVALFFAVVLTLVGWDAHERRRTAIGHLRFRARAPTPTANHSRRQTKIYSSR